MPELDVNDPEVLAFAEVIGTAPQIGAVSLEAAASPVLDGHFADRDPVLPKGEAVASADLNIAPPIIT